MLCEFELEDEVLDVLGVNFEFLGYRSDGYFILNDRHEVWVDFWSRYVE